MATTYELNQYKQAPVFAAGFPGVIDRTATFHLGTLTGDASYAFIINDIIKCFKLPQGAKVLYGRIECDDLDDHATPTLELDLLFTDGTTHYTLVNGGTVATTGGIMDSRDATYGNIDSVGVVTDDADWYVYLKAIVAAAGDAAAAPDDKIVVTVGYTQAVESDEYIRDFPTPNP